METVGAATYSRSYTEQVGKQASCEIDQVGGRMSTPRIKFSLCISEFRDSDRHLGYRI